MSSIAKSHDNNPYVIEPVESNKQIAIVHLIYRFDIGGLETVMASCINCLPDNYIHTVISLTSVTAYANDILSKKIKIIALNKKSGNDISLYFRLFQLLRHLSPDVLHTYNLPTIEFQVIAFLLGIKTRVHAEHGRNFNDPLGRNPKYILLRKLLRPFIHYWVAVSNDLYHWLNGTVGIKKKSNKLIYNGIDTEKFHPLKVALAQTQLPKGFPQHASIVVGTIGRLDPVKNQSSILDACEIIKKTNGVLAEKIVFAIIGDGPLFDFFKQEIIQRGLDSSVWLPGARYDVVELLQHFNIFILPSITEGIPMTMLEAMSTELPVIATEVGGIPEVISKNCGLMIKPNDAEALANAILYYLNNPDVAKQYAANAKQHVIDNFSVSAMIKNYQQLYQN